MQKKKKRVHVKLVAAVLVMAMIAGCTPADNSSVPESSAAPLAPLTENLTLTAGTFNAAATGLQGPLAVEVTVSSDRITSVKVTDHKDTLGVTDNAVKLVPERIVEHQSLAVDLVAGATITSAAIIRATEECLESAGADISLLKAPIQKEPAKDIEKTADVIIVGGGGAGMAAAVAATDAGASVIVIEKTGFLGGNSIVSGGIYNAPDPERQDHAQLTGDFDSIVTAALAETPINEEHKALIDVVRAEFEEYKKSDKTLFDSVNWFALQTWNGGDKVADLDAVKVLAENALSGLKWMESLGMEYRPTVSHGPGALYPRTHGAVLPAATGYFQAFANTLESRSNYEAIMEVTAKSLIMEGNKVIGVNAVGKDGNKVTLYANNGVIMATGGFAGNIALRQQYCEGEKWPDLGPSLGTTNMPGITGDGIFMAQDAGAELVNMDQIQLLFDCNPITGIQYDICSWMGAIFVNKEGTRFVREDGRRDEMSNAIMNQTGGIMYYLQSSDGMDGPETVFTISGKSLAYMMENNLSDWTVADTLQELAQKLGMPADALEKTVADFNACVDGQKTDEFGRISYRGKIETGPFYAYPRKPSAHHTMGGVKIDTDTHALRADSTIIEGLYCAGEITGVVHGGNRLGGNAIVDFVVYGRIAGTNAAADK